MRGRLYDQRLAMRSRLFIQCERATYGAGLQALRTRESDLAHVEAELAAIKQQLEQTRATAARDHVRIARLLSILRDVPNSPGLRDTVFAWPICQQQLADDRARLAEQVAALQAGLTEKAAEASRLTLELNDLRHMSEVSNPY